ncbi:hypothetical protein GOP47_0027217 [Adiantum capillus-veneris]|nr:hypothetical protein GOP47_0027217 [Adiantum capillus-veneris]
MSAVQRAASIHDLRHIGCDGADDSAPAPAPAVTESEAWKACPDSALQHGAFNRRHSMLSSHIQRWQASSSAACMYAEGFPTSINAGPSSTPYSRQKNESACDDKGGVTLDYIEVINPPPSLEDRIIFQDRDSHLYFGRNNHHRLSKAELVHLRDMFKTDVLCLQLLQGITGDNLWEAPDHTNMQVVPLIFESVDDYVRVFEPLLIEECRAQLRGNWEKLTGGAPFTDDSQFSIDGLYIDRKGWLVLVLTPIQPMESFNDGDVAVMQVKENGLGSKRKNWNLNNGPLPEELTVGILRNFPRINLSAHKNRVLFYIYSGSHSKSMDKWTMYKCSLSKQARCSLRVLGPIVTTKREYVALHTFQNLHSKMCNAVLKPSLEIQLQKPKSSLPKPLCWAEPFLQTIFERFNKPQSNAILWAATHSVEGASIEETHEDVFPFTIVQGPPGTGKTHTLLGILNVIHLVLEHRYRVAFTQVLAAEMIKLKEGASAYDSGIKSLFQVSEVKARSLCQKPRIMVCAPSNAAVDELLTRVVDRGFFDSEMKPYRPKCIRLGLLTQCTGAAHALSIKNKVQQLVRLKLGDIERRLEHYVAELNLLDLQLGNFLGELTPDLFFGKGVEYMDFIFSQNQVAYSKFQELTTNVLKRIEVLAEIKRLSIVCARYCSGKLSMRNVRAKLEKSFSREAEIVFTTLSSSRAPMIKSVSGRFDVLIVDEAAQASEVATLPPLTLGASHCILVGDPKQLAATVISSVAQALNYSRSLFERLQLAGCPVLMLCEQYRMHPQIREFPSCHFYQGRLHDNKSVLSLPDEEYHKDSLLRPYLFFDIAYGRESQICGSGSFQNVMEAKFAAQLYEHLLEVLKSRGSPNISVGVITPYKLQLECLKQEFESLINRGNDVYFNTVDAFQGQERDVMIMSCVRAGTNGAGFVADTRRMNVALTRAHRSLWVIGNARTLCASKDWKALIANAKGRGCFIAISSFVARHPQI